MQAIRTGIADVIVLDASDVYTAGLRYDLIPIISEVYNLGEPEYYVVAVAKEDDPSTELTYLRGKYTCHPGINTAAGWVSPATLNRLMTTRNENKFPSVGLSDGIFDYQRLDSSVRL